MRKVIVIGGGISGLSAAFHMHRLDPTCEVSVIESEPTLGGVIETTRQGGFMVEHAADNFITTTPNAIELCEELGLGDELIRPQPSGRHASVLSRGRLEPIPPGFIIMAPSRIWPMVTTRILSLRGKLRAIGELFVRKRRQDSGDESMASFVCRRFGCELFERLVQPLVGGIYTADPRLLSVAATMPRFIEMEQEHGSLIRAAMKQHTKHSKEQSGGARYSQFMTLRGGMARLIETLASRLPPSWVRCSTRALALQPGPNGRWSVHVRVSGNESQWLEADGVIVATPTHATADLLDTTDPALASDLRRITYASCSVIALGYRRSQVGVPLDSFGFVVPLIEGRSILSCSYSSVKYEGRAPEDCVLLRIFIGGACQSALLDLPDDRLVELAEREVADLMNIQGEPVMRSFTRHTHKMPQYHVGHCDRVKTVDNHLSRWPTLRLAGSGLHGVGVPNCIKSGRDAAEQLHAALGATSGL